MQPEKKCELNYAMYKALAIVLLSPIGKIKLYALYDLI